jgi:hypothetical protein
MGTRHYQTVIDKEGNLKIAQYGQWDGYPSGQGVEILDYLREANLEKYQENLSKIHEITDEEANMVDNDDDWTKKWPWLSRDCGSHIHQMIEDGHVPFVSLMDKEEANKWCEGFYCIDFNKNTFSSRFYGQFTEFFLDKLPTIDEYLEAMDLSDVGNPDDELIEDSEDFIDEN